MRIRPPTLHTSIQQAAQKSSVVNLLIHHNSLSKGLFHEIEMGHNFMIGYSIEIYCSFKLSFASWIFYYFSLSLSEVLQKAALSYVEDNPFDISPEVIVPHSKSGVIPMSSLLGLG